MPLPHPDSIAANAGRILQSSYGTCPATVTVDLSDADTRPERCEEVAGLLAGFAHHSCEFVLTDRDGYQPIYSVADAVAAAGLPAGWAGLATFTFSAVAVKMSFHDRPDLTCEAVAAVVGNGELERLAGCPGDPKVWRRLADAVASAADGEQRLFDADWAVRSMLHAFDQPVGGRSDIELVAAAFDPQVATAAAAERLRRLRRAYKLTFC